MLPWKDHMEIQIIPNKGPFQNYVIPGFPLKNSNVFKGNAGKTNKGHELDNTVGSVRGCDELEEHGESHNARWRPSSSKVCKTLFLPNHTCHQALLSPVTEVYHLKIFLI